MAYDTIGFKDGTTPLDATNFNKMDEQIKQNADDIDGLSDDLTNQFGSNKIRAGQLNSGASLEFSATSAFVFAAYSAANYAIYWVRNRSDTAVTLAAASANLITITCSSGTYTLTNGTGGSANYLIIYY